MSYDFFLEEAFRWIFSISVILLYLGLEPP